METDDVRVLDTRRPRRRAYGQGFGLFALLARYTSEQLHGHEAAESVPLLQQGAAHRRGAALPEDLEEAQAPTVTDLDEIEPRTEWKGARHVARTVMQRPHRPHHPSKRGKTPKASALRIPADPFAGSM